MGGQNMPGRQEFDAAIQPTKLSARAKVRLQAGPQPGSGCVRRQWKSRRNNALNIAGEITVAAPREAVFKALSDAPFFASCIDGVRDLNAIDATHYTAVLETRIAYLRFNFKVDVEMTRLSPPEEIAARVEGTPMGMVGRLAATATTRLSDAGGGTLIRYSIDATLTGKLGSMGQPVLKAKAKEMERHFSEKLAAAFSESAPGTAP
jgi:uncharacterized protein